MTTEELVQVFGQTLAEDLPDYEVVFLPNPHPLPVEVEADELSEEEDVAEGESEGLLRYDFQAFGR